MNGPIRAPLRPSSPAPGTPLAPKRRHFELMAARRFDEHKDECKGNGRMDEWRENGGMLDWARHADNKKAIRRNTHFLINFYVAFPPLFIRFLLHTTIRKCPRNLSRQLAPFFPIFPDFFYKSIIGNVHPNLDINFK